MTLRSSNLATKSRFAVSDFLSDIKKVSKGLHINRGISTKYPLSVAQREPQERGLLRLQASRVFVFVFLLLAPLGGGRLSFSRLAQ